MVIAGSGGNENEKMQNIDRSSHRKIPLRQGFVTANGDIPGGIGCRLL
jgi:hypothetical protein